MADVPADMSLGDPPSPARMSLVVDTSGGNLYMHDPGVARSCSGVRSTRPPRTGSW